MTASTAAALALIFLLGVAHSLLGEHLIFRHLRADGKWLPTGRLKTRQIRALWSTWHLLSLFGWALGAVLWVNSGAAPISEALPHRPQTIKTLFATFLVAALFWLFGTKGKHPAWIVFLVIAALLWAQLG